MGVANTSSRTLRLLTLLQTQRHWSGGELASRLGVSVRTLRRDLGRLRDLGYPVDSHPGIDGGYQLAAGAALPPLALDDEEAVALAVGMQAAVTLGLVGIEESAARALAKVVQVMPRTLRRRIDALRAATDPGALMTGVGQHVDTEVLVSLATACRDAERVHFDYIAGDGSHSQRRVEPHRLVPVGRRWYLVAYDVGRQDWRSFRLDRIHDPEPTGVPFRPRTLPTGDAAEFVRAGLGYQHTTYAVKVVLTADADEVRRHVGRWATITDLPGDQCLLEMTGDSLNWPLLTLGTLGVEFEVRSPPELAEMAQEWSERFARSGTP